MTYIETDKDGTVLRTAAWKFSEKAVKTEQEVVRGYDGKLYLKGEEPAVPEQTAQEKVRELETAYNMNRWQREGILAEPEKYSAVTVARAQEIEALAAPLRGEAYAASGENNE